MNGSIAAMMRKRKSLDEGHRRKFLVVIDETPECEKAVIYAAKRSARTGGALVMLVVIEPEQFQHWLGVENIMKAEARDAAAELLAKADQIVKNSARIEPELVIREGKTAEEIIAVIEEDEDIAILVLAASPVNEGPGPLVSSLAGQTAGTFSIPVTIVPGTLSEDDMNAIA